MQVSVVTFKRSQDGRREVGVAISAHDNTSGEVDVIVDADGRPVKEIWDYNARHDLGSFSFNPKQH